jgi:mRNA interferase YafQ
MQKRAKNLEKLKKIIRSLIAEEYLEPIYRDHKLIGNWIGRRECHIEPNWLLIYKVEENRIIFERTGTQNWGQALIFIFKYGEFKIQPYISLQRKFINILAHGAFRGLVKLSLVMESRIKHFWFEK